MPRDPTPAQQEASRRNGARSRGPTTPEGKARARRNALAHGLRAEVLPLLPGEDEDEFRALLADVHAHWPPRGPLDRQLALRLAGVLWRLRRVPAVERMLVEDRRWPRERRVPTARLLARAFGEDHALERLGAYERRLAAELRRILRLLEAAERTRGRPVAGGREAGA